MSIVLSRLTIVGLIISKFAFGQVADCNNYLAELKLELQKQWPNNRTVNLVFHGHSVPSGYFKTPYINRLASYPFVTLEKVTKAYPKAVVNCITTSIGGENSKEGSLRFANDVGGHKPDVVFVDYALNDRNLIQGNPGASLAEAKHNWIKMIQEAMDNAYKLILLTPTPDTRVNILAPNNILEQHAQQIRFLADSFKVGLVDSYRMFRGLVENGADISSYMATVNHPNEKGHEVVSNEIMRWFADKKD